MAKAKGASDQAGKVKIRVIEFEVEGSDATMQESLKSITAALNRGMTATPPSQRVRYVQAPTHQLEDVGESAQEEEIDVDEDEEAAVAVNTPRKPTPPKKPRSMTLLEIAFNDTSPTLKEFAAEKSPKTEMNKYLVIAYWYKNLKGIVDLSPDHFFTAYRHLQWPVPADPAAPMRELRHKRRTQFSPGNTHGTSTINHVGEEIVLAMGRSD